MIPSDQKYPVDLRPGLSVPAMVGLGLVLVAAIAFDFALWGIVLLYLALLVALAVFWPVLAVFGAAFAIFTNTSMIAADALGIGFVTEGILAVLSAVAFMDWLQRKPLPLVLLYAVPIFGFYLLMIASSLFVTVDVDTTSEGLTQATKTVALAAMLICVVRSPDRFDAAIAGILCAASFLSLLTIYQAVVGEYGNEFLGYASNYVLYLDGEVSTLRFGGPVGEPNFYAQILLLAYPIALSMALAGTGRLPSVFLFGVSGLVAAAIALTQSRGGLICLLALSILALRPSRRNILLILGMVSVLGLLLVPLVPAEFTFRLVAAFSDVKALVTGYGNVLDTAIAGRVSEMLAAWHVFLERPWLGSGYATFESLYQDTARRYDLMARGADRQAHNLYLEILSETGLAGLLSYASMIAFAVFSAVAGARRLADVGRPLESAAAVGLALSILGYLLSSVFLHEAFQWYLWMMVALAVAAPAMHLGLATAHAEK